MKKTTKTAFPNALFAVYTPSLLMEKNISLTRSLPLDDSWDVIVVGGGPAGSTAAIAAAREGAKTLLIEQTGALGGSGTSALVPAWCPFSDKDKIIYRGLAEKVFEESKKDVVHIKKDALDWVPIDAEKLKRIYDKMVTDAGATVLFHTFLSSVEMEGDAVSALIVSNKKGLSALRAKVYVDCSGDADLSAWAGAEFHKGDENGEMQPATHCFILGNVDDYAYIYGARLYGSFPESPIGKIVEDERYPEIIDRHICNNLIGPGTVGFNAGHVYHVVNTDPISVSKALMQGRRMAEQYRAALAEYTPTAFSNCFVVSTGSVIGIRETRRIVGDYVLTLADYATRRTFDDEICRNSYFIDIHLTSEEIKERDVGGRAFRALQEGRVARHPLPLAHAQGHPQRPRRRTFHLLRAHRAGQRPRHARLPRDGRSRRAWPPLTPPASTRATSTPSIPSACVRAFARRAVTCPIFSRRRNPMSPT